MKKAPCYYFDGNSWIEHHPSGKPISIQSLKVITYNVLFNKNHSEPYKPHIVCSEDRWKCQMKMFVSQDADIIGLNEVTKDYITLLMQQDFVKQYYVSCHDSIDNFGNIILSKYPFESLRSSKLTTLSRRCIIAELLLDTNHSIFVVVGHLRAGMGNYDIRKSQMDNLYSQLDEIAKDSTKLIIGDLNFHSDFEDDYIRKDFVDVWKIVNSNDPGFTFDGYANPMICEMWPLGFMGVQMRLDRMLLCSSVVVPEKSFLMGNCHVYSQPDVKEPTSPFYALFSPVRMITSQIGDLFGKNLLRDPQEYLFPSDHFGICTTFKLKSKETL